MHARREAAVRSVALHDGVAQPRGARSSGACIVHHHPEKGREGAMRCEEIMQTKVEFASEDDAVLVAADKMRRANIGFLPVCNRQGRVVGALTDRDIATRLVAEDLPSTTAVRTIMTRDVVACLPADDVHFAEELMATRQRARVVCIDRAGRLQGVLSLADVAQWETERAGELLRQITARETSLP
jgi:CBS domain-containing protein